MRKAISFRQGLLKNLAWLSLTLIAAMLAATYYASRTTASILSASLTEQGLDLSETRVRGFFDPVQRNLELLSTWIQGGALTPTDVAAFNRQVQPLLESLPQITSMQLADERGNEFMLLHKGDHWSNRITRREQWGARVRTRTWSHGVPGELRWNDMDYDPRQRPWYRGALKLLGDGQTQGKIYWSQPYRFFSTQQLGISVSRAFRGMDGQTRVLNMDVLLEDVSRFTRSQHIGKRGLVILLNDDGTVLGLPAIPRFDDPQERRRALLAKAEGSGVPVLEDAAQAYYRLPGGYQGVTRFSSGGRVWWGGRRVIPLGSGRSLIVAVLVSEDDLLVGLGPMRAAMLLMALIVVIGAAWRARSLAARYSLPIEALVVETDRISRGDLRAGPPLTTEVKELNQLAAAHERLRQGVEQFLRMEEALQLAHRIQEASLPLDVPQISGYSVAAWSEPAEETGGDTYDVVDCSAGAADEEELALTLADATGHGIGPALSVTQFRAMLRMALLLGVDPVHAAVPINRQLYHDLQGGRFITAWLGRLVQQENTLYSFSAGQAPLVHYCAASGDVLRFEADTPPLGILDPLLGVVAKPVAMEPGDQFLVLSDGVIEARNPEGEEFGMDRLYAVIRQGAANTADQGVAALRQALDQFTRGEPARDDRTVLWIQRNRV